MTELKDCFDVTPDPYAVRIRGTRIDWEHVVRLFQQGMPPEEIATAFASPVPLGHVYAAVARYLLNPDEYHEYVRQGDEALARQQAEYLAALPPEERARQEEKRQRLRDLKARFTDAHGRLDVSALRAHLAAEPVGAGA